MKSREGSQSMSRHFCRPAAAMAFVLLLAVGCAPTQPFYFFEKGDLSHYVGMATKLEAPDVKNQSLSEVDNAEPPLTLTNNKYEKVWDLSLEEAIHITLQNSKVMRTLGARFATQGGTTPQVGDAPTVLLTTPQSVTSVYDPAIIETNPNLGPEARWPTSTPYSTAALPGSTTTSRKTAARARPSFKAISRSKTSTRWRTRSRSATPSAVRSPSRRSRSIPTVIAPCVRARTTTSRYSISALHSGCSAAAAQCSTRSTARLMLRPAASATSASPPPRFVA